MARQYKYYDLLVAAYVCVLLCANLIGPAKFTTVHLPLIGNVTFIAGVLFFPISYFFGDVLTEVYGYARDRRCVWAGFGALAFASLMAAVIVHLPPSADYRGEPQRAVETIFGSTWRIVSASIIAFWSGSLVNSFVMAKMKIYTRGRWLWSRAIGSTICGEAVDTGLFMSIAFLGTLPVATLLPSMLTQYLMKVGWEVLAMPLTYRLVGFLKRVEHEDYYDYQTNFTPFSIRT